MSVFHPLRAENISVRNSIQAGDLERLKLAREQAERVRGALRDSAWFEVAGNALRIANSHGSAKEISTAEDELRKACAELPPASLAALAARGPNPIVSVAYARSMAASSSKAVSPSDRPSGRAEAAAESRDGLARFGPKRAKDLLDVSKESNEIAFGAGGASQSVYRIGLIAPDLQDSTSSAFAIRTGMFAGVRSAAGSWARRFILREWGFTDSDVMSRFTTHGWLDEGAGVLIVLGGDASFTAAAAAGSESRVPVIDARGREARSLEPVWTNYDSWRTSGFQVDFGPRLKYPASERTFSQRLAYRGMLPVVATPSPCDQARALADAIESRTDVRTIAIALPSSGGDYVLARCFESAMHASGRRTVEIEYAPGRRDFTPEARRFREADAQAILFAGAPEESEEWLIALRKARLSPLILGTTALDPMGMHDEARSAAEKVMYVGDDWEFLRATDAQVAASAAERDGFALSADYRRGFRLGQMLARAIVDGAFTPSRLYIELDSRAREEGEWSPPILLGDDARDRLPIYVIRNGKSERTAPEAR